VDSGEHGSEGSGRYVPGVDPVARFTQLVTTADPPLDECALLIAATRSRHVDVAEQLSLLDSLAAECPGTTLGALRRYLFRELGFRGNTDNYYDPANSCLNEVLARRTGIPITLGIVVAEVGRRIGIGLSIVGLPGHVVVGVDDRPGTFVDAFHDGALLDVEGCAALLERVRGPYGQFDPLWLAPLDHHAVLLRMLANLKAIALQDNDRDTLAWVQRLRCAVPGVPENEHRELARFLSHLN
jgi:regulator of sirC expression with transglutaminase-like and TPR domain